MNRFLENAIQLAKMAEGQTGVNPAVGSVVVNHGRIVGLGAHLKQGERHAEVQALDMAGDQARGGTIYVSLEPCTHYGSTPPCVNKIIEAGISKVVYAMKDITLDSPGDEILKSAGIEVVYQHEVEAEKMYKDFFAAKVSKIPEVTLKVSVSLDGKQATDSGQSQWITNPGVKQDVLKNRARHDAILTGAGTVEADNPSLTVRIEGERQPIRVILDKSGSLSFQENIFHDQLTPVWLYTENNAVQNKEHLDNINIIQLEECSVHNILRDLYNKGIGSLYIEAGPNVSSQFLQSECVQTLIIYYAPKVIGGSGKYQFYQTEEVLSLDKIPQFEIANSEIIDQNIKVSLRKK
ncbi:bifunctional diaminohydroxyphosphoribosylaminopyrimidine deaminase/5-amino-6-(5-phosphoribosylamino)uracil reductase RibD [Staphylococcus carnosus]|uniref:bifunctional diaminohydroxyphosphoribosylaminopyrimidine deaminase/5-amino-6-(5-phosphoribosylamino)uracil reductase RibD n=1 Tax=Staphylococcus carnosus TaxID=1281 RepID=UPI00081A3C5A|nr:bifunctional diaminohydroxyphosphoribosylaminopyrimidine deaminase/5-amino-6-(5-phosphoribosylamino)uracil reductase RibD [Staphylococcus carnosus]ANZ33110.1 riboflavin biosynthesis protein RibD [Staphylococcus carnosus]UTB80429.1 riboflavin biosynthesis protein RibD [Staphylococcus carnosus]UTB85250.1 riboflavin biosynthesis protein RibD [Staphylococcus carnosus]